MLTLTPIPEHIQMDWSSLDPKNEINTDKEDDKNSGGGASAAVQDALSKHFEESLKKFQSQDKDSSPSQNGFHSQNRSLPDAYAPFVPQLDVKPWTSQPHLVDEIIMPPQNSNDMHASSKVNISQASCSDSVAQIPTVPQQISEAVPTATVTATATLTATATATATATSTATATATATSTATANAMPPGPYDVEAINTILKTIQYNRFINSSILKPQANKEEIKIKEEEGLNPTQTNGQINIPTPKRAAHWLGKGNWQNLLKQATPPPLGTVHTEVNIEAELPSSSNRNWQVQIKQETVPLLDTVNTEVDIKTETPTTTDGNLQNLVKQEKTLPVLGTVNTEVDIEAELPCTSIQQKKKARPRKKEVKEENLLEKQNRVLKQCSKRSTKRKTNYREASSDEEPKFIASSRSRPNNKVAKPDIKKNSDQIGNVPKENLTIKSEPNENKTDLEIKIEPTQLAVEIDLKIQKETGAEAINEMLVVTASPTNLEMQTQTYAEIKVENGVEIQKVTDSELAVKMEGVPGVETKPIVEIKMEAEEATQPMDAEITDVKNDENNGETKEVTDQTIKLVRKRTGMKKRRNRRIRHSTLAAAAAARNRALMHPLTRQEQLVMNQLMETKEPFLQNIPCLKLSAKVSKCRECRCASFRSDSMFCRFYDFRRLRFKDKGVLVVDGFSDPNKDPGPNDIEIWMLGPPPKDIDLDVSRFILMHVGDQFCRIWQDEQSAVEEHMAPNKTIAWKKVVKGVREICDVCEATLFNFHWTCNKCGFGVCLDCYRDRKNKKIQKQDRPVRGFDDYGWLVCSLREPHEMVKLMLTQIIPGNALNFLADRLHQTCKLWKIPQKCGCPLSVSIQAEQFAQSCVDLADKTVKESYLRFYSRECEIKYLNKIKGLDPQDPSDCFSFVEAESELIEEAKAAGTLPTILVTTLKHLQLLPSANSKPAIADHLQDVVTKEYNLLQIQKRTQKSLPQKVMTLRSSREMFPGIAHDWLCNGKLLRLLDSRDPRNALLFQEAWKRGQPIMVSELCKFLNIKLWHPEAFCVDFGEKKNDLINCMTGNLVPNQPMKLFWEGFQCVSKRLLDANGQPMLLKLKDWPPGDDFAEILPTRFKDLMSALPLPEYTLRTGGLNIASRLPAIFVPPDLGPKMYNAYGSALHPDKGTTNLHLDISDAVNIMVYVGIPTDASAPDQIRAALSAIDSGGCDLLTRRRVRQPGVMPGALWHIYSARDADKIRDLLNRVTIERGYRLEPDHDPIHDQNWYLDNELRERLYDDYGVEGYPIVQCLGDAVFIPAGAPHQVRNLHNCIKVAEDFVSPENIQHCFHLSQQFRKLSMSHTNHEDKLQIRNVIYHSIKETTSHLAYLLNQKM